MYICPVSRTSIVSFINGYEAGSQGDCIFTDLIRDTLEQKYDTKYLSSGWPDQIKRYGEMRELAWNQAFIFIASEVLNEKLMTKKTMPNQSLDLTRKGAQSVDAGQA